MDLVDADAKGAVMTAIREINAGVEVIETQHCKVDIKRVLGVQAFDLDKVLQAEEDFLDTEAEHQHDDSVSSLRTCRCVTLSTQSQHVGKHNHDAP